MGEIVNELTVEELVLKELRALRDGVAGVRGSIVATSEGLLIAHDLSDTEPTRLAAIVATTIGLARQAMLATDRGGFHEAVAKGSAGYLAVYAAGRAAVVAVIGGSELNVAMLHYEMRDTIGRITAYSSEFASWASPEMVRRARAPDA
jgi:uncharacterized protein